ncbi:MAG: GyrI-like domain-containing protein [Maritimibacter sp.]
MADFEIIASPETTYLYVERTASMGGADIAEAMGSAFMEVFEFMTQAGIVSTQGAIAVYDDYTPGPSKFRAGFIIQDADASKATGAVMAGKTPKGRAVHTTHFGAYSGMQKTYGEMHGFVKNAGVDFIAPTWEVYVNDPSQVAEDDLITECYQAIAG